jgi:hypothetical protein
MLANLTSLSIQEKGFKASKWLSSKVEENKPPLD